MTVAVVAAEGGLVHGRGALGPWIAAPVGASAVLLFALPSSPMSQPWPIIVGNTLSALVGVAVGHLLGHDSLACGVAVGAAFAVMSLTRSLHPPGSAAALTATLGGPAVSALGWEFPFLPVAMNATLLVASGLLLHRLGSHRYPHRHRVHGPTDDPAPSERVGMSRADLDAVLEEVGESFDIDRDDLHTLLLALEARVLAHERPELTCATIMSRDLISISRDTPVPEARRLLLERGVRLLPVLDTHARPVGAVGLRELDRGARRVSDVMVDPFLIDRDASPVQLVDPLTDGHRRAAMVTDGDSGRLVGLITQADLLAALARPHSTHAAAEDPTVSQVLV